MKRILLVAALLSVSALPAAADVAVSPTQTSCAFKLGSTLFARWQELSASGRLGCPLNNESEMPQSLRGTTGRWAQFLGGPKGTQAGGYLIAATSGPQSGTIIIVDGCFFMLYSRLGGPGGVLGFPVANSDDAANGDSAQRFEGGRLTYTSASGLCGVANNK